MIAPGVRFGAYRVDSLLGSGGMASVYLVFHEGLGRYEAMKVLPHHLSYDRNFSARFLAEARTAAKLRHGGIATIFSVSDPTESEPYFTMQYIQGRDLSKVIEVEGQMSLSRTVLILRQVAEALDYAHSQGVIHRDVKPGNVLLEEDGKVRAYVVDFGIARAQESEPGKGLTQTGMIVGTPEYMSPEQAGSGSPVGAASDQYGLAAVAYEMLCGRSPFGDSGSSTMQILTSHLNKTPETPRRLRADLPSATSNAVLKALSKNPSDRFPSCTDFVNSLEGKIPVTVPRSSSGTKPFATVAAVLIGLLGVGLVGMALTRSSPPPTPAPLSNPVNPSDTTGTSGTTDSSTPSTTSSPAAPTNTDSPPTVLKPSPTLSPSLVGLDEINLSTSPMCKDKRGRVDPVLTGVGYLFDPTPRSSTGYPNSWGVPKMGAGSYFEFQFKDGKPRAFDHIEVIVGYDKLKQGSWDDHSDRWGLNGRVREARIVVGTGSVAHTFDTNERYFQTVPLQGLVGTGLRFEIVSAVRGSGSQDVCISRVKVYATPE